MGYILALDEGTTNVKAVAVSEEARILTTAKRRVNVHSKPGGHVEQDADEIWNALVSVIQEVVRAQGENPCGIAISNQRESVVAWDKKDGRALSPIIGWQDTHTQTTCRELNEKGWGSIVRKKTGLTLDAMFSASKMASLYHGFESIPSHLAIGTIDTWLISKLTGGKSFLAEAGNASRTLLMNTHSCTWDEELCEIFSYPRNLLAPITSSDSLFGTCEGIPGITQGTPIISVLGDSHAALFGHGCTRVGLAKVTYGTGSSVMVARGENPPTSPDLPYTCAWQRGGKPFYAAEGNIVWAGSAMDWIARTLGVAPGKELDDLARESTGENPCVFVPAFTGLGAPWWKRDAKAILYGMTATTSRADIARAGLESTCHQVTDVVESLTGVEIEAIFTDGGPSRSHLLMGLQADMLATPVYASQAEEISALGAALMGFSNVGWSLPSDLEKEAKKYTPTCSPQERQIKRDLWKEAVMHAIA